MKTIPRTLAAAATALLLWAPTASAHSGPPYPAVSGRIAGAYNVAVWTDPDTTDDRSAQGKFWVTVHDTHDNPVTGSGTRVEVSVKPTDRPGALESTSGAAVKNDPSMFFAALLMDHEGPFAVHVAIDGPLGHAELDCQVQATYDLRPAPWLLALYVMPFLAVALLWGKLLLKRRRSPPLRSRSGEISL